MREPKSLAFGATLAGATAALLLVSRVDARPDPKFSLSVSPARLVIPSDSTSKTEVFTVSNDGLRRLHVDVFATEFTQARNGRIIFERSPPLSAASWVKVKPTSFDIGSGQERRVRVSIALPTHPEPGERAVGLIFRVPPPASEQNVAISGAIGAQLLINVPGPVIRKLAFEGLAAPAFADGGPIPLTLTVRNLGNVHRDFRRPHNLAAAVGGRTTVPFPNFTVLANSTREVEAKWLDPPLFCLCKLAVRTQVGQGDAVSAHARVIVFPIRLAGGALLAAIGLLLMSRRGRKKARA